MSTPFKQKRYPGGITSAFDLTNHVAISVEGTPTDPHPQYLLRSDYGGTGGATDLSAHISDPNAHYSYYVRLAQISQTNVNNANTIPSSAYLYSALSSINVNLNSKLASGDLSSSGIYPEAIFLSEEQDFDLKNSVGNYWMADTATNGPISENGLLSVSMTEITEATEEAGDYTSAGEAYLIQTFISLNTKYTYTRTATRATVLNTETSLNELTWTFTAWSNISKPISTTSKLPIFDPSITEVLNDVTYGNHYELDASHTTLTFTSPKLRNVKKVFVELASADLSSSGNIVIVPTVNGVAGSEILVAVTGSFVEISFDLEMSGQLILTRDTASVNDTLGAAVSVIVKNIFLEVEY